MKTQRLCAVIPPEPGKYRFPSGSLYARLENGVIVSGNPKVYKSKAEKKALKRLRQQERDEDALLAIEQGLD